MGKRAPRVVKPNRGEQEPFSRQLARERKENARLRQECKERIYAAKREAALEVERAWRERDIALEVKSDAVGLLNRHRELYTDFARVAPVLRSKSFLRRLWWGLRFGVWGVFGYEEDA